MDIEKFASIVQEAPADHAEIRFERKKSGHIAFQGKELEQLLDQDFAGGCVRVCYKGSWGFASFGRSGQARRALERALALAKAARRAGEARRRFPRRKPIRDEWVVRPERDPLQIPWEEKVAVLKRYNEIIRGVRGITLSTVRYREMVWEKIFVGSDGTKIRQCKWDVALRLAGTAKEGANVQTGTYDLGVTGGFDRIANLEAQAEEAAKEAVRLLKAPPCPSGVFPVVTDPEVTGLFAHEAFGHLSEADFLDENRDLQKIMAVGRRFGRPLLSIVDDGTAPDLQGTWKYDDEGTPMRRTELVKEGVFNERLHSRETAGKFGDKPTGNARAISHVFPPIVRMTNTFVAPGKDSFEEMLDGVSFGIYAVGDRGGQTNCEMFTFTPASGYLIEKGKLTKKVRDVTLSGNVFHTLRQIDRVGSDLRMIGGLGGCGKGGQSPLPVTIGGPHMRIQKLTVGGGR